MLMFMYMYVCIHASMSLSHMVVRDHYCGGMLAYVGEWHDDVLSLIGNQVGRVDMTHI